MPVGQKLLALDSNYDDTSLDNCVNTCRVSSSLYGKMVMKMGLYN